MNDSRSDPGPSIGASPAAADSLHDPSGDDTCEALLAAGRDLFARQGYDGASIRAITGEAGVNLGAVTYHFGSKEALYHEVLRRAVTPLRTRVEAALAGTGPVLDRAEAVVDAYFDHLTRNPDLPRLLLQEMAAGRVPPPPVTETLQALAGGISALVREGQGRGEIRDGTPLLFVLSLLAQPVYLVLVQNALSQVLGLDLAAPEAREGAREHVLAFARAGLAADRT